MKMKENKKHSVIIRLNAWFGTFSYNKTSYCISIYISPCELFIFSWKYLNPLCLHIVSHFCREGKKKQNCKCVRYSVNGECRVFLVATRDIPKGERLYYDYNGYEHEYPTHYFVWSYTIVYRCYCLFILTEYLDKIFGVYIDTFP